VTYEQLVIDPVPVLDLLAKRVELPDPDRMKSRLQRPSGSTHQSEAATRKVLERGQSQNRQWLVEKWKKRVDADTEHRLMEALSVFEIDAYTAGSTLPTDRYWVGKH
jgi:hypothetical protein